MAWLWGNGFDFYNNADGNEVLSDTNSHTLSSATGIGFLTGSGTRWNYGQALNLGGQTLTTVSFANSTTIWINNNWFCYSYSSGSATKILGFRLRDGSSNQVGVWLTLGGYFVVTTGLASGTILATSPALFNSQSWHHFQIKIVINNTTGSVAIRRDGNSSDDWNSGSINTRNGTVTAQCNTVAFSSDLGAGGYLDDTFIFNDQGSAPNTWQGDVRAVQQMPASDSSVQWSRSTGSTNYSLVDESISNQDTDYVFSNTVNQVDAYNVASLVTTPSAIICIQQRMCFRRDDSGPHTVKAQIVSGGTTTNSADMVVGNTYQNQLMATYLTDPNTGLIWTATTANAVKIGPAVVV